MMVQGIQCLYNNIIIVRAYPSTMITPIITGRLDPETGTLKAAEILTIPTF